MKDLNIELEIQEQIRHSVKRNKSVFLICAVFSILLGLFFPVVDIFDLYEKLEIARNPYPWGFAIFFWAIAFLFYPAWIHQNTILKNWVMNEMNLNEKMINSVEKRILSNNEWKFFTFDFWWMIIGIWIIELIFFLFPIKVYLDNNWLSWEHITNIQFFPFLIIFFIIISLFSIYFLKTDYILLTRDSITKRRLWISKTIRFQDIKDFKYNSGLIKVNQMVLGRFFTLEILGTNNIVINLNSKYTFWQKKDDVFYAGDTLFWILEQIQKKDKET